MVEDTKARAINIAHLERKIVEFDSILEQTQEYFSDNLKAYEAIVTARDYIFRMRERLRGCDVVNFCGGGGMS
jgi:hypothetical protein